MLTLCDELNEDDGDDGRNRLTREGAARLARALRAARAFVASYPPHPFATSPWTAPRSPRPAGGRGRRGSAMEEHVVSWLECHLGVGLMRSVLFLGKGGAGKTTCALGAALALARGDRRTLVASVDPAHSLGDLADRALGDAPTTLEPGLEALEVDLEGRRRRAVAEVAELARRSYGHLAALGLDSMAGTPRPRAGRGRPAALRASPTWSRTGVRRSSSSTCPRPRSPAGSSRCPP